MAQGMSFVAAVSKYFGRKAGQTIREFKAELDGLTADERVWFALALAGVGYDVAPF